MADYTQTVEDVKKYYEDLLILQYKQKPRARETIGLWAELYMGNGLIFQLNDCLNIDEAIGAQLDLIGKILGCKRQVPGFTADKDYFTFEKTDALGYSYKNQLSQGFFKKGENSIKGVYSLLDGDYRQLLKFKAEYNRRNGSMQALDDLYWTYFGDDIKMVNNQDLSVTYDIKSTGLSYAAEAAILLGYIKPPMGISYTYNYV